MKGYTALEVMDSHVRGKFVVNFSSSSPDYPCTISYVYWVVVFYRGREVFSRKCAAYSRAAEKYKIINGLVDRVCSYSFDVLPLHINEANSFFRLLVLERLRG